MAPNHLSKNFSKKENNTKGHYQSAIQGILAKNRLWPSRETYRQDELNIVSTYGRGFQLNSMFSSWHDN